MARRGGKSRRRLHKAAAFPGETMSRRLAALAAALLAGVSIAHAKDSVTIGMTLEPPGLDPTTKPAAAIGEIVHYNVFEGLTKINEDFSVTPLLADSWTLLDGSEDADAQPARRASSSRTASRSPPRT